MSPQDISALIDQSPMNRGAIGAEWLAIPGNLAVPVDQDVMLFEKRGPSTYEFHWLETKSPLREKIANSLTAIDHVFAVTSCSIMYGCVPSDRRDSKMMARWIGAEFLCHDDTPHGPVDVFIMTRAMRERNYLSAF